MEDGRRRTERMARIEDGGDGGRRGRRTEMMEVEEEDKDGMEDRGGGDKNREDGEQRGWRRMTRLKKTRIERRRRTEKMEEHQ